MLTSYRENDADARQGPGGGWVLALDTSAERAGVALFDGERLHEAMWPADRRQTTELMPRIDALLRAAGVPRAELSGIAVAQGPGTFTGLRVGMSVAKGLALALGIPLVGVPTLAAVALPWARAGVPVAAVLPAGRGRLVWQLPAAAPVNGTPAELLAAIAVQPVTAIVGELPAGLREALAAATVPVLGEPGIGSRIGAVALLGHERLARGDHDDVATLEPVYLHGVTTASRPVRDARP